MDPSPPSARRIPELPGGGILSAWDAALAAVRHLATPGQSANAPAGGPLLFDVRSVRHRRWGRSGWANAAHPGRRSPGLVCGHGLAGLPPPVATIDLSGIRYLQVEDVAGGRRNGDIRA